jgi:aspartyl/glutamyl-tRNA(Asn/Gln) amidotransferase C subunit
MSKISLDDIKKLSSLAKIEISETEEQEYLKDIASILDHLSLVSQATDETVQDSFLIENHTRADEIEPRDFDRETIFKNVRNLSKDNYIKVSKVIKK